MARTKVIFIAYAVEDEKPRNFIKEESYSTQAPFEFIDTSVKKPFDPEWRERVRAQVKSSDGVLVLVTRNWYRSSGQQWEIQCARQEGKPICGIWLSYFDKTNIEGVPAYPWTNTVISDFIDAL